MDVSAFWNFFLYLLALFEKVENQIKEETAKNSSQGRTRQSCEGAEKFNYVTPNRLTQLSANKSHTGLRLLFSSHKFLPPSDHSVPFDHTAGMVKYILTPWRDREELLLVRHQFYAASPSWLGEHSRMWHQDTTKHGGLSEGDEEGKDDLGSPEAGEQERRRCRRMAGVERLRRNQRLQLHQAVARVSMWMQRGNCPHMVESTALLTAAVLSDEELMVNTKATGVDNVTASSAYAVRAAYSAAFSR